MSEKKVIKPVALAVGAALAGSFALAGAANATDTAASPFQMASLEVGYMLGEGEGKCGEGKCGDKKGEGACGEGKCGEAGDKEGEGACGEGKCGEGKCGDKEGEGKCGDKEGEGKCGEGSCGNTG